MKRIKRTILCGCCVVLQCAALLSADQRGIAVTGATPQSDQSGVMPGKLTVAMGHGATINSLAYSPDGKYLATASVDKTVKLWNTETGKELWTFSCGSEEANVVAYSPDGKYVAAGDSGDIVTVLDAETGVPVISFNNGNSFNAMAYSPDSATLFVAKYKGYVAYNATTGETIGEFNLFTGDELIDSLAVSPDGKLLVAGGSEGAIVICNARDGRVGKTISHAHDKYIKRICFSPDGRQFASGGYYDDHNVRLWTSDGRSLAAIDSFKGYITGLSYSADGSYLAMIDSDANYKLYNVKAKKPEAETEMEDVGTGPECLSFSPDGQYVAAAGFNGWVTVWNVKHNKPEKTLSGFADDVKAVAYRPDNQEIACGAHSEIHLWNASSGMHEKLFSYDDIVNFAYYSADSTRISSIAADAFAVNGDAKIGVSAELTGDITIFDAGSNSVIRKIDAPFGEEFIQSLAINPAGNIIAAGADEIVKIWDVNGRLLATINDFGTTVGCIDFQPDGKYVYMLDLYGLFQLWDVKKQKVIQRIDLGNELSALPFAERSGGTALKCSPDGRYIATGNQTGTILLFDSADFPHNPRVIAAHKGWITSLSFNSDGTRLVSGSKDGTAKIWDTATGTCLVTMLQAKNGEWLSWTNEGFYAGSDWASKNLVYFVNGRNVIGIDQMYDTLYRPDLVAAKLAGKDISDYVLKTAGTGNSSSGTTNKLPPDIAIAQLPATTDKRDITVELRVTDNGGGIGAVNLVLNGKVFPVAAGADSQKGETATFRYLITVQNGKNTVVAQAYNKAGSIVSQSPEKTVSWAGNTEKPRLFVLAVAANKYRAQGLQLKYSIADADGITAALQKSAGNLYRDTIIKKVYDADVTAAGINAAFDSLAEQVQADDVFVFYLAGHGVTYDEDGDYYYLPVTFRFTEKSDIPAQGISKKMIMQNLAKIKAGKSVVLMDTCSSGTFVVGSRSGLSEATAINRLTRATGSATIAAGSDEQVAMEGYNGHGIFTYVLMDGLSGKADSNKDGFVTMQELCSYAEYEVPELSYAKWGYEQVPQKQLKDQDFPIGKGSN